MKTWLVVLSMAGIATPAFAQDPAAAPPMGQEQTAPSGTVESTGMSPKANAIVIGIQANGSKATGDVGKNFDFGFGFGARGGYELHLNPQLTITPELAINWNRWSTGPTNAWVLGILPGARAGWALGMATPWLGLHVGLDHGDAGGFSSDKFGLDVGAGADFALSKGSVGPFVSYNIDFTDVASLQWVSFGIGGSLGI